MAAVGRPSHAETRLASEITVELSVEYDTVPAGRVLSVVVRAMDDLRRIAVSGDTAASLEDYRRVITETARHYLARDNAS